MVTEEQVSEPGTHFDKGKLRVDLVPPVSIYVEAEVFGYGSGKYGDRNWESGISLMRLYGSVLRHLLKWASGQDIDDESGLPHLSHAKTCIAMMIDIGLRHGSKFDNRPTVLK